MSTEDDSTAEPPLGPGNPPIEYRWKKGCPSPNPRGRPPKRKHRDMLDAYERLRQSDEYSAVIAKVGNLTTAGEDPKVLFEGIVRNLYEIGFNPKTPAPQRIAASKLLMDAHREATRYIEDEKHKLFESAVAYKDHWTPVFRLHEKRGGAAPSLLPHPDDVIIHGNRDVEIVGPIFPDHQEALNETLTLRGHTEAALVIVTQEHPELVQLRRKLERQWRKCNRLLPPRLQKPFPRELKL